MPIGLEQWRAQIGALEAQRYRYLSRAARKAARGGQPARCGVSGRRMRCWVGIVVCVTLLGLALSCSLLLLRAGDIEKNPGPFPDYNEVDDTVLKEEDIHDVNREIATLAGRWESMYFALRLQPDTSIIAKTYPNDPKGCLRAVLLEWLRKNYECQKHGPPTWRMLVKTVAESTGGSNRALADTIAERHQIMNAASPEADDSSIRAKVDRFELRFEKLIDEARSEIEDKRTPLKTFRLSVTQLPIRVRSDHLPYIEEKLDDIKKAGSIEELFLILNLYWSFLDYSLLEHLVQRYGSEALKECMSQYVEDMASFRQTTTVGQLIRIWPGRVEPPPNFSQVISKLDKNASEYTLEELENLRRRICSQYRLSDCVLMLAGGSNNSVILFWYIPSSLASELTAAVCLTESSFFEQLGVLKLEVDGFCAFGQKYTTERPRSPTEKSKEDPFPEEPQTPEKSVAQSLPQSEESDQSETEREMQPKVERLHALQKENRELSAQLEQMEVQLRYERREKEHFQQRVKQLQDQLMHEKEEELGSQHSPTSVIPGTYLSNDDLPKLCDFLPGVDTKWIDLGVQLGIPMEELDAIKSDPKLKAKDSPQAYMEKMLSKWLYGKVQGVPPTLEALVEAETKLASKVRPHLIKQRDIKQVKEELKGKQLWWRVCEKAPRPMYRGSSTSEGSKAYFRPAWSQSVFTFDAKEEKWSQLPPYPNKIFSLVVVKGHVTGVGGKAENGATNALLSLTGEGRNARWAKYFPPMPTARWFTRPIFNGRHLIVAGGANSGGRFSTVEVMDTENDQWYTACSLPNPYDQLVAAIANEKLYLLGGMDANGALTHSVLVCSLSDLLQSCNPPLLSHTASQPEQQLQLLASQHQTLTSHVVWHRVADIPVYVSTCASLGGRLIAIGGYYGELHCRTSEVFTYSPDTNEWLVISHMPTARSFSMVVVLPRETVMVVGGNANSNPETDTVEMAFFV